MSVPVSFGRRLASVALPTKAQVVMSLMASLVLIIGAQWSQVLTRLGIGDAALNATRDQFHERFSAVLTSQIASSAALVTFWAAVGLIAYIICWGAYNILIEARNEVTLETQYTNRGHWRGPFETMGLKAAGAVLLGGALLLLKPGIALWLSLSAPVFGASTAADVLQAIAAVAGLAVQLYLILAFALLTFTPWYRAVTFTDQPE